MTADDAVSPILVAPAGLSRRARQFVEADGIRLPRQDLRRHRDVWLAHGIPAAVIKRGYRGETMGLGAPRCLEAHVYQGLDEWRLYGG